METFVQRVAAQHGFDEDQLRATLLKVEFQQGVIRRSTHRPRRAPGRSSGPGSSRSSASKAGSSSGPTHESWLQRARDTFGVPEELIVAIIGVETLYGRNTGNFRVIDAISTLAFQVPARATFFQNELEEFLLLCRGLGLDPLAPRGSYAGAMGWPQFIPSSYRRYARDFDGDGRVDLWTQSGGRHRERGELPPAVRLALERYGGAARAGVRRAACGRAGTPRHSSCALRHRSSRTPASCPSARCAMPRMRR